MLRSHFKFYLEQALSQLSLNISWLIVVKKREVNPNTRGRPQEGVDLERVPDSEEVEEATPTSRQLAKVVGEMDEVEDTPHPRQLAGVVVLAEVEEEGYPLTTHTTCWVMVRVPQEKRVTYNPLRKWRSRPNLDLRSQKWRSGSPARSTVSSGTKYQSLEGKNPCKKVKADTSCLPAFRKLNIDFLKQKLATKGDLDNERSLFDTELVLNHRLLI